MLAHHVSGENRSNCGQLGCTLPSHQTGYSSFPQELCKSSRADSTLSKIKTTSAPGMVELLQPPALVELTVLEIEGRKSFEQVMGMCLAPALGGYMGKHPLLCGPGY